MLFGAVTAGICAYALQYATTESSLVILAALYAGLLDFVLLPTQVYAAELYPARIRATGCAWVGAFGRIGGACAPTVVGYVLGWSNVSGLWLLMGTVTLVGGVLIFFIKQETAQVSLEVVSKGAAAA
jgi:putative MFS transporter